MAGKQILGAHIFSAGTWNKQTFTEADLDGIVSAFNEAGKAGRVPLKFGHAEEDSEQPFREGLPALGWVSKIWRQGKQLMADFTDIPSAVFESIRQGLYKFTSIELLKNAEYDGKRFPHLLDAVALLGAEPPAVDGLADLQRLALSRASFKYAEALQFTAERSVKVSKFTSGDLPTMDEKQIQALIEAAILKERASSQLLIDAEKAKFAASEAEKVKLAAKLADQEKAEKAGKIKLARDSAEAIIEAAVRTKKILPAKRALFAKTFNLADDEAVLKLDLKDVELMCEMTQDEAKKVLATGKSAFSKDKDGNGDSAMEDGEDHALVTDLYTKCAERARKSNISIFQAMNEVVREDMKLGQRFLSYVYDSGKAA